MAAIAVRGILGRGQPRAGTIQIHGGFFQAKGGIWHPWGRRCRGVSCCCAAHAGHVPVAGFFVMISVREREEVALAFSPFFSLSLSVSLSLSRFYFFSRCGPANKNDDVLSFFPDELHAQGVVAGRRQRRHAARLRHHVR